MPVFHFLPSQCKYFSYIANKLCINRYSLILAEHFDSCFGPSDYWSHCWQANQCHQRAFVDKQRVQQWERKTVSCNLLILGWIMAKYCHPNRSSPCNEDQVAIQIPFWISPNPQRYSISWNQNLLDYNDLALCHFQVYQKYSSSQRTGELTLESRPNSSIVSEP